MWWQPGEEYNNTCVLPTVKHGGVSVMVWGCMSAAGTGELRFTEGTMNSNMYCDILKQIMIPSLQRLGRRAVFQHDNEPKYTSKTTTALLKKLRVKIICGASSNGRWRRSMSLTSTSSVMLSAFINETRDMCLENSVSTFLCPFCLYATFIQEAPGI